jgi:polyhydroxyalkanoate synthesis regulator phasin
MDALRGYAQAVAGLTELTRQRARELAQAVLASSQAAVSPSAGVVPSQVSQLAEDMIATARSNRTLLLDVVRTEVERSVNALGLAGPAEVKRMQQRVAALERRVEELEDEVRPTPATVAKKATVKKAAVKKAPATKAAAQKSTPLKSTPLKSTAQKATAKKATAKKAPAPPATPASTPPAPTGPAAPGGPATPPDREPPTTDEGAAP